MTAFEVICWELTAIFGPRSSPSPAGEISRQCKAVGWELDNTAFCVLRASKGTVVIPWSVPPEARHYLAGRVDAPTVNKKGRSTAIATCSKKLYWDRQIAYLDIWTWHDLRQAIKLIECGDSLLPIPSQEPPTVDETLSIDGRPTPLTPVYRAVLFRDQGRCVLCGSSQDIQFDHIIPRSRGGPDSFGNLRILCRNCNLRKSDRG